MTKNRAHKQAIRSTMKNTGENYTRALHVRRLALGVTYRLGTYLDTGEQVLVSPGANNTSPCVALYGAPGSGKLFLARSMVEQFLTATEVANGRVLVVAGTYPDTLVYPGNDRVVVVPADDPDVLRQLATVTDTKTPALVVLGSLYSPWGPEHAPSPAVADALESVARQGRSTHTAFVLCEQQPGQHVPAPFLRASSSVLLGRPDRAVDAQNDWRGIGGQGERPPHPRHLGSPGTGVGWAVDAGCAPRPMCALAGPASAHGCAGCGARAGRRHDVNCDQALCHTHVSPLDDPPGGMAEAQPVQGVLGSRARGDG